MVEAHLVEPTKNPGKIAVLRSDRDNNHGSFPLKVSIAKCNFQHQQCLGKVTFKETIVKFDVNLQKISVVSPILTLLDHGIPWQKYAPFKTSCNKYAEVVRWSTRIIWKYNGSYQLSWHPGVTPPKLISMKVEGGRMNPDVNVRGGHGRTQ